VAKIIHQTVVVECERCGRRSDPLPETDADAWLAKHEERVHLPEDRAVLLAEHGHVTTGTVEWFDQDDSSGYVTCSCGFKSRSMKTCWLDETCDEHLKDMQAKLGLELASPAPPEPAPAPEDVAKPPRSRPSPLAERQNASAA
jgi:hypothetical protein